MTRHVVGQVYAVRREQKLSAQKLADRCDVLGYPVPRSILANLEGGRRESITIDEVIVLARALGVPVARLLPEDPADGVQAQLARARRGFALLLPALNEIAEALS